MKLHHEDSGQLSVLTFKGDLTCDHIDLLERTVRDCIDAQVRDFVLDLSEVEFIDSKGLESLLSLQETCSDLLGQVRLAGVGNNLEDIFRVTRLLPRFEHHATVEEATNSLRI